MSDDKRGKKFQPSLNKAGAPVKKRDKSKRYSMFYESTESRGSQGEKAKDEKNDDGMTKSNSLNDINKQEDRSRVSSLNHAKNLRSSLFVKQDDDMVKYMKDRIEALEKAKKDRFSNTKAEKHGSNTNNNSSSSDDDQNEEIDLSHEVKTMNIQFSSSPSLSALAGYLTDNTSPLKSKNTNVLGGRPFQKNMNNIFEEEEEEEEEQTYRKPIVESKLEKRTTHADQYRSTTVAKEPTIDIENNNIKRTNSLRKPSIIQSAPIANKRTTSLNEGIMKKNKNQEEKQKKSSIFSIFRKKSINRKVSKNENEYLPVSETFSNRSALAVHSNNNKSSIISTLRQTSNSKPSSTEDLPSSTLPKLRSKNGSTPIQRKDVGSRASTSFTSEQNINKKVSVSNSETSNMTTKSSPKILGEDVFPKHLDMSEISSIQTLEKAKRASLNLTPNTKRISLTDSISIKQENEGMFVEYDSNLQIHTPDLSKSPTSSILRSGKFDNSRNSMVFSDSGRSTNRNSLILSDNGRRSNRNSRYENRTSLLSNGNNNKSSTSYQILEEDIQKPETPLLDIDFDFEDSEYVSEIMEFKNIIDFGDYIDLDFDVNEDSGNGNVVTLPQSANGQNSSLVLNGLGILSTSKTESEPEVKTNKVIKESTPDLEAKEDPYLPTLSPVSADTPTKVRPLSMSFKGLNSNEFTNLFDDVAYEKEEGARENHEYGKHNSFDEEESYAEADSYYEEEEDFNFYDTLEEDEMDEYNSELDDYVDENFPTNNKKSVHFASRIILFDTYTAEEYDRRPDLATCNQLTPELAMFIREEVNTMKGEMDVHQESIQYTHFL